MNTPSSSPTVNTLTIRFDYTGSQQTFIVPYGVTDLTIDTFGAQGGGTTGVNGGRVTGTFSVDMTNKTLYIYVGGSDGYNGGGSGVSSCNCNVGGGASDVRYQGTELSNRIIVGGGGGGGCLGV